MKLCYHCMNQTEDESLRTCPYCGKKMEGEAVSEKYLKPGTVLQNKFIVGYPLGAGGFGNTYIGWNRLLLRKVAVKEFYPEQYITRGQDGVTVTVPSGELQPRFRRGLQQFLEEARSVASLQDIKGVVEISNFFEENGTGYIIMEYLEGMDVKTILSKSGNKKDYEWCRRVILTLLYSLREIHKRGVLHRDIAPDNIFVTNEGVIKLIDFGAARHASDLANLRSDIVLKTGYAPIEQYSRNAKQGPYTDLYAVAALFYRMLTGQKPIPANERLNNDALVTPSEMGVELPAQAEMAIMVCLNVKPEFRLQSADEFMEALDGQSFVPVYEPKWILPAVKEKKRFSNLPVPAKIAICASAICLLVGGLAGGVTAIHNYSTKKTELGDTNADGQVVVVDYSGKRYDDVKWELDNLKVSEVAIVYEFSAEDEGVIIRQEPEPGKMDADTPLKVYVSGGDSQFTLEDFNGKTRDYLMDYFTKYNFNVRCNAYPGGDMETVEYEVNDNYSSKSGTIDLVCEYSDGAAAEVCYAQNVAPGELCRKDINVTFSISCGRLSDCEAVMPDLYGMSRKEAEKALEDAGLAGSFDIVYEESETHDYGIKGGRVLNQSIGKDVVINSLEHKTYRYEGGKRTEEQALEKLVLTLNKKKTPVRTTESEEPQWSSPGELDMDGAHELDFYN